MGSGQVGRQGSVEWKRYRIFREKPLIKEPQERQKRAEAHPVWSAI